MSFSDVVEHFYHLILWTWGCSDIMMLWLYFCATCHVTDTCSSMSVLAR